MIFRRTISKIKAWHGDSLSRGCNELAVQSTLLKRTESEVFFKENYFFDHDFDMCMIPTAFCDVPSGDALVGQSYNQCFFFDVEFHNRRTIVKYYKPPKYPKPEFFCLLSNSTVNLQNNLKKRKE